MNSVFLRNKEGISPTTIADAIEVLRSQVDFRESHEASIQTGKMELPSGQMVGLVCATFKSHSKDTLFAVALKSANSFRAFPEGKLEKRTFNIDLLDEASFDGSGKVTLANGQCVRALEVVAASLPKEVSDLDLKIIQLALKIIPNVTQFHRSIKFGISKKMRKKLRGERFLDFSKFPVPGALPYLKNIQWEFTNTYSDPVPSEQKIADALAKVGLRKPHRRPGSATI